MKNEEKKLSCYIDELNAGRKPIEHNNKIEDLEQERLMETVRKLRLLREPQYPGEDYPLRIASALRGEILTGDKIINKKIVKRAIILTVTAVAAAAILFFAPKLAFQGSNTGIVYAMEQAMKEVKAYHGILQVIEVNELGDTMSQAVREVWADNQKNYYLKELEGTAKGIITVNNGKLKWQLRPEEEAAYLFATFPDPYRFTFELAHEIEDVKAAKTIKEVGEEIIAGRSATILEVTPKGGDSYHLWVDQETDLPLQRQSAMQNAIQYQVTYTEITLKEEIPAELLTYQLPEGYAEVDTDAEQIINTLEEAESIVGFLPTVPDNLPGGYTLIKIAIQKEQSAVKFYYATKDNQKMVVIQQMNATQELKPASTAILGKVNYSTAEILVNPEANAIRWQEEGREYSIIGNTSFEELTPFAKELTSGEVQIPSGITNAAMEEGNTDDKNHGEQENSSGQGTPNELAKENEPEVKVEVDLTVEENEQKSVDAGHSPWKLDPVFVTQVYASLLLSPEGITGDYPIAYEDIVMIENDGIKAIAQINSNNSVAKFVYLERLIRQDETGIWTVVGYDKTD